MSIRKRTRDIRKSQLDAEKRADRADRRADRAFARMLKFDKQLEATAKLMRVIRKQDAQFWVKMKALIKSQNRP